MDRFEKANLDNYVSAVPFDKLPRHAAPVLRHAGAGGMTKFRAVAHLGMGGGGWIDSKKLIWISMSRPSSLRQAPTARRGGRGRLSTTRSFPKKECTL